MASSACCSPSSLSPSSHLRLRSQSLHRNNHLAFPFISIPSRFRTPFRAYRKSPNYPQDAVVVVPGPRTWVENDDEDDDDDDDDEEEEEDRSLDLLARFVENVFRKISRRARKAVRSVLPPSFSAKLDTTTKKVIGTGREQHGLYILDSPVSAFNSSANAELWHRRPGHPSCTTLKNLVSSSESSFKVRFSVNGFLILAFLWILKAFLEVVCTLGSMVFSSILLVRGVWAGISFIREQRYYDHINRMDNNNYSTLNGAQPAT